VISAPAPARARPGRGASISDPHRRYDPLADEWLLVSAGRTKRPWSGRREKPAPEVRPVYDPQCYLCPGNVRANGDRNPDYANTFVFTNDFAALRPDTSAEILTDGLLTAQGERGTCKVMCFSPRHDLSLADMPRADVRPVVDAWADLSASLGADWPWVQVFENHGAGMGASNPHPHGQVWAGSAIPSRAVREDETQRRHFEQTGQRLLLQYAAQERGGPREIVADEEWLVVVPFWAAWPYETLIIPTRPVSQLPDLDDAQREALTDRLLDLLRGYDALFDVQFPYSMGWHQAPFDGTDRPHWQLHAHVYPPLLRADVRKFMVGYELLSELQRDITAEDAAAQLRDAVERGRGD
jgi:UDPglucose--hexose-1-phosphate uridylyltransferase